MRKLFCIFTILICIFTSCKTKQVIENTIIEPEFEIVSIIIIQADLINTQFETVLKIDNPNNYELIINSLKYRLYGKGKLWAEGVLSDEKIVPAESSINTSFRFSMNFINMDRNLLDDVIAMRRVQYAFKGDAEVTVEKRVPFIINFDISGLSDVKPKAN